MSNGLKAAADAILQRVVSGTPRVPGVVAMATDRNGNIYEGAAGKRMLGRGADMTTDTVFAIFSTTKAITGTAVLQLVEEGKLDLDAPAKNYAPDIGKLQVLEGFDDAGKPKLRPPKRDITTRMLMLHTAGFGYDFFSESYNRLAQEHGQPSVITASKASIRRRCCSIPASSGNTAATSTGPARSWRASRGKRLGEVMQERIFAPLGMTSTGFSPDAVDALAPRRHPPARGRRLADAARRFRAAAGARGPHGRPRALRDGRRLLPLHPHVAERRRRRARPRAEAPRRSRMAVKNGLGDKKIKMLPGVIASLSNDAEFFPGMPKSWALTFMINDEDAPTGRPAGALGWAGLANLFYWIDRKNGLGGFWATQVLPFADPVSFTGYMDFETAVYRDLPLKKAA